MALYKVICVAALLTLLAAVSIPNPLSEDSTLNITSNRTLRQKRSSNIGGETGLGKMHARNEAFFLPWEGSEYWYKDYEVLTMNKDISKERISNVRYNINQAERFQHPPEAMGKSTLVNNQCREVTKTHTISNTYEEEKRWDTSIAISAGVTASITAGIPSVAEIGIQVSTEVTNAFSSGTTLKVSKNLAVDVEVNVPPNHSCSVSIVGNKYSTNIPYTARLTRTYRNGRTASTTITGVYKGVNVVDFKTVADRCVPIPNAKPCE
ncbi:natterin-3-like [Scomber scombrus]|uniref:natterin-3-like n=1 Tax=Scomber scombrus TaxID=13677 RepID=UPI002DDBF8C9|nr:natterin-3-like [Scomber scombrus]